MPPFHPDTLRNLAALETIATQFASRAVVPYSGKAQAVCVLLSDGLFIPGVRVETASFSLVIPAVVNAASTAVALERTDVVALSASYDLPPFDRALLAEFPLNTPIAVTARSFIFNGEPQAPRPSQPLTPWLDGAAPTSPREGIALARDISRKAYTPLSRFPVGCVLITENNRVIPGVNVERSDWSKVMCAERNAVGTVASYDLQPATRIYVSCLRDPHGSPCGACRQVLAELAPDATLWMDRGTNAPERSTPADLLPGSFSGAALLENR